MITKLCIECIHCEYKFGYKCDLYKTPDTLDIVTGLMVEHGLPNCHAIRKGPCTEEGIYWEPKPIVIHPAEKPSTAKKILFWLSSVMFGLAFGYVYRTFHWSFLG